MIEGRYGSLEEARKHLKELISKNRAHLQDIRQREFQAIQEEISERDEPQRKFTDVRGICSYKMPKIKVESKDATHRHLKMVLDGISGKIKLPLTSKSSLEAYNYPSTASKPGKALGRNNLVGAGIIENRFKSNKVINQTDILPNIGFRDKNQEILEKEQREIEKSLRQFRTLKDINDVLLKTASGAKTNPSSPVKHQITGSYHTDSRENLQSRKRSPHSVAGRGLNNVPSQTSLNSQSNYGGVSQVKANSKIDR